MAIQSDGQAKCDECGKLDGNPADIKLIPGWTREDYSNSKKNPLPYEEILHRHYCPDCSKGRAT